MLTKEQVKKLGVLAFAGGIAAAYSYRNQPVQQPAVVEPQPLTRVEKFKAKIAEVKAKASASVASIWATITAPYQAARRVREAVSENGTSLRAAVTAELPTRSTVIKAAFAVAMLALIGLAYVYQAALITFATKTASAVAEKASEVVKYVSSQTGSEFTNEASPTMLSGFEATKKATATTAAAANEAVKPTISATLKQAVRI